MVISKEIYDRVVHYSDEEYKALTGDSVHVQGQVERHYLHLLAAGSSCTKDHTALTADRLDCVKEDLWHHNTGSRWCVGYTHLTLFQ